jgi:hypothetical protein
LIVVFQNFNFWLHCFKLFLLVVACSQYFVWWFYPNDYLQILLHYNISCPHYFPFKQYFVFIHSSLILHARKKSLVRQIETNSLLVKNIHFILRIHFWKECIGVKHVIPLFIDCWARIFTELCTYETEGSEKIQGMCNGDLGEHTKELCEADGDGPDGMFQGLYVLDLWSFPIISFHSHIYSIHCELGISRSHSSINARLEFRNLTHMNS